MFLITDDQCKQLVANNALLSAGADPTKMVPVVTLSLDAATAYWLVVAINPDNYYDLFALCDVGYERPQLATVKLSQLVGLREVFFENVKSESCNRHTSTIGEYLAQSDADDDVVNEDRPREPALRVD